MVLVCKNLNSHHQRVLCAKFGRHLPRGSGEDKLSISSMHFLLIRYHFHLEECRALHLNKLEFPSPKDALFKDWLKLAQWLRKRIFLNDVNVFLLFPYFLALKTGMVLDSFEQT